MTLPAQSWPVAIVGGGFLGSALAAALPGRAIVTTRSGAWRGDATPANVQVAALDLTADPLGPAPLAPARSLVICVAPGGRVDRRALYVEGTRRLLHVTRDHPWQRIVYIGSTSAVAETDGWVFESDARRPDSERGRIQREAEDVVRHHCAGHQVPWWVLRLGGLYGPGREIGRLYRRRGHDPLPGDGHVPTNLIHRDDAVQAVLAALAAPCDRSGVVHVVDDDHTPRRTMYRLAGADVTWTQAATPGVAPHGKRISNLRLKTTLGVRLLHPAHVVPAN